MDRDVFLKNSLVFDAVMRHLTIIGEAAKQLPDEVKSVYPTVEWRKIGGFRDLAVHRYFNVDEEIVWSVVHKNIPEMLTLLGPAETLEGSEP